MASSSDPVQRVAQRAKYEIIRRRGDHMVGGPKTDGRYAPVETLSKKSGRKLEKSRSLHNEKERVQTTEEKG